MKIIYKKIGHFFIIVLLIINLIFCESQKSNNIKSQKKLAISFKDQIGRIVNLEKPAESIIIMPNPLTSMLIAIDQSEKRLKGMNSITKKSFLESVMKDFFPGIAKISTKAIKEFFVPNMEEILRINPDLIFQWGMKTYQKYIRTMENIGLNVAAFKLDGTKDWVLGQLKIIGEAISKKKKANKLIQWRQNLWQFFKKEISKIKENKRPRTLYFWKYKQIIQVREWVNMNLLGVNYPARSKKAKFNWKPKTVNIEQILKWDPEIIFLSTFKKDLLPEDVYKNKLLSEVSAVKNKRVYKMPLGGFRWDPPNHESPLSWMWMAIILYPDYFNFDLRKEIKTWYEIMYGQVPTDKQINSILRIDINKNSKDYQKFM